MGPQYGAMGGTMVATGGAGIRAPREGVDGNWKCTSCSNVNFVQRMQCNRCQAPKPPPEVLEARQVELLTTGGDVPKPGAAPVEGVDGNWRCTSCANVNWMQREACFRCSTPKPPLDVIEARAQEIANAQNSGAPSAAYPKGMGAKGGVPVEGVDGNWRCLSCSNINWAQREACHRCNAPKPAMGVQQYMDAATGQVYNMSADGQIAPANVTSYGMAGNGMASVAGQMGGTAGTDATSLTEMRQRPQGLETQVATMQATLQPQISNLSAALQQVQTLVAQMQQQMLSTLADSVGSKRKAESDLVADDPKRLTQ